jgi:hypothetical protein
MTLQVVGAGLSRVATNSLKLALERLLGAPCYHMNDVFEHPEHIPVWHAAAQGRMPNWHEFLSPYRTAVGWPPAAFWPELSTAFPDAIVLLAVRDAQSWWESVHITIFPRVDEEAKAGSDFHAMFDAILAARFTNDIHNRDACIAAFERHNAQVRERVSPHRLLEWQMGDGWEPLCTALNVPVPDEPFPHLNTQEEFLADHES